MKFLDTSATESAIRDLLAKGGPFRAAVAYWGVDAVERLKIQKGHDLIVVCDLLSGGCNPGEIKKLQKSISADRVLTHDRLHAKTWIAKSSAIVGSSNASANGLGFEGSETASLVEANLLMEEPHAIAAISRWWDEKVLPGARAIGKEDLRLAEARWKRRRTIRPISRYADLLAGLRVEPEAFRDRGLFVWVYEHGTFDRWVTAAIKDARVLMHNDKLECWQDIDKPPPPGSHVIDFNTESDPPTLDGIWRILVDQPIYEPAKKQGKLLLCTRVTAFEGLKLGSLRAWRLAAAAAAASGNDEWTADDFGRKFFRIDV